MRTNHLFASAAVAAVLVMTGPAQAQILGGAVRGGAGGAFAGSFGSFGGTATGSGRLGASGDTSLRQHVPARRAANDGASAAAKVGARASDATAAAVSAGREKGASAGQSAMTNAAAGARELSSLDAGGESATATTATVVGTGGHAMAGESGPTQQASRPGNTAQSNGRAPARGGSSGTQSATGAQSSEKPHPVAMQAGASTSASAEASGGASTAQ